MRNRSGFSLVEILIVIALIVLLLAMALPAFNFITGSHSTGGAENQISAMLARARTEAVGLQEPRGIMFYQDPVTQRVMIVLVKQVPTPIPAPGGLTVDYYIDTLDEDHIALPRGVAVEVIRSGTTYDAKGVQNSDGFTGFNQFDTDHNNSPDTIAVGGFIMFDAFGRLASVRCGLAMKDNYGTMTAMNKLIALKNPDGTIPQLPHYQPLLRDSGVGVLIFDEDNYKGAMGQDALQDLTYQGIPYTAAQEGTREKWIQDNAEPVLVNRYNGTLVKGG